MAKKQKRPATTNATLLKLKNTPFKTATEMKAEEERICREEWENIERAKHRRLLFRKEENKDIILPFKNGFKARFVGDDSLTDNLVRVFLTADESVQIEIDDELKSKDSNLALQGLVKSITESFMNGYLSALGLKDESLFQSSRKTKRAGET